MKKSARLNLLISLVLVFCQVSWGRDRATTTTNADGTTTTATTATPTPTVTAPTLNNDNSIVGNAQNASSGQKGAASAGKSIGPVLMTSGSACVAACSTHGCDCGLGYALIGGGVLALMAGSHNAKQAAKSDNLANQFTTDATSTGTTTSTPATSTTLDPAAQSAIESAKKAGVTVDLSRGTMTLPNGNTVNLAAVQTPEQLGAAVGGMSAESMAALKARMAKAAKGADSVTTAAGSSGSGGGADVTVGGVGGRGGSEETGNSGGQAGNGTGKPFGINRNPAQVAGMCTRLPDGSCMGVASESIFTMIDRRFDLVCQQGQLMANCPKK